MLWHSQMCGAWLTHHTFWTAYTPHHISHQPKWIHVYDQHHIHTHTTDGVLCEHFQNGAQKLNVWIDGWPNTIYLSYFSLRMKARATERECVKNIIKLCIENMDRIQNYLVHHQHLLHTFWVHTYSATLCVLCERVLVLYCFNLMAKWMERLKRDTVKARQGCSVMQLLKNCYWLLCYIQKKKKNH